MTMAMTANEALERATAIWGAARRPSVQMASLGGWYVTLTENRTRGADWTPNESRYVHHALDGNGHTFCHAECSQLEAEKGKTTTMPPPAARRGWLKTVIWERSRPFGSDGLLTYRRRVSITDMPFCGNPDHERRLLLCEAWSVGRRGGTEQTSFTVSLAELQEIGDALRGLTNETLGISKPDDWIGPLLGDKPREVELTQAEIDDAQARLQGR